MYEFQNWPTPQEIGVDDEDIIELWQERVAICTFDGDLTEQQARRIAWQQINRPRLCGQMQAMGLAREPA